MDDSLVGNLEDEAKKRKERLQSLKRKRENKDLGINDQKDVVALPKPKFRSHIPKDEALKENVMDKVKAESVEEAIKEHLAENKPEHPLIEEVDLTNLAPRKPDWDLKRDISKKLEKLERRTKRAIAEITREQLAAGGNLEGGAELAGAVRKHNADEEKVDEDDED